MALRNVQTPKLTFATAQERLTQMSTHLRTSASSGKEALLQKHPDDVRHP